MPVESKLLLCLLIKTAVSVMSFFQFNKDLSRVIAKQENSFLSFGVFVVRTITSPGLRRWWALSDCLFSEYMPKINAVDYVGYNMLNGMVNTLFTLVTCREVILRQEKIFVNNQPQAMQVSKGYVSR